MKELGNPESEEDQGQVRTSTVTSCCDEYGQALCAIDIFINFDMLETYRLLADLGGRTSATNFRATTTQSCFAFSTT